MSPELSLLLACSRITLQPHDEAEIRCTLDKGIDWTLFAQTAVNHGLACLAGDRLAHCASDLVPDDILAALQINLDQTRQKNIGLFTELTRVLNYLAEKHIEAIPIKGPILAIEAYGDLGFRVFHDLDFLIHDSDTGSVSEVLRDLGYERRRALSEAQIATIQRLQGQEILFNSGVRIGIEPHTRLTPSKFGLDIDYPGLWSRARRTVLLGETMLTLAPEDTLLTLAIHGGKEMWWNIKWACDVAAFLDSHPSLDWTSVMDRARSQGCVRLVLLAAELARKFFGAAIPANVVTAAALDRVLTPMIATVFAHWQADDPTGPPSNRRVSLDRLRLHDGLLRKSRYILKTAFLPGPHHVMAMPLPAAMSFAYVPLKLVHDFIALPLWRVWQAFQGSASSRQSRSR